MKREAVNAALSPPVQSRECFLVPGHHHPEEVFVAGDLGSLHPVFLASRKAPPKGHSPL